VNIGILVGRVVRVGLQDLVYPQAALVRSVVIQKVTNFDDGRNATGQVEMHAAEELGIVSARSRLHVLAPGAGDPLVDFPRQILNVLVASAQSRRERQGPECQSEKSRSTHGSSSSSGPQ